MRDGPVRLVASLTTVFQELGDAFASQLTYPGIYRGSPLSVSPVIVECPGKRIVVISEADSDACRVMSAGFEQQTYGRYFSWGKDLSEPVVTFAEAVRLAGGTGTIDCDTALPVSRYEQLAASGPVVLPTAPTMPRLHIYMKSRAEIEAQWLATRDADTARLAPFIETLPHGRTLLAACT
ncbi:hypothetical protein AB4144_45640, partial [Rhizobiaceae sp. 2RAB30]